jgi:hypothetical protein
MKMYFATGCKVPSLENKSFVAEYTYERVTVYLGPKDQDIKFFISFPTTKFTKYILCGKNLSELRGQDVLYINTFK